MILYLEPAHMADLHPFEPGYLRLIHTSELAKRVQTAFQRLEDCDLCPWKCRVNRGIRQAGDLQDRQACPPEQLLPAYGGRETAERMARIGNDLFRRLQYALPVLPEPRDQPDKCRRTS